MTTEQPKPVKRMIGLRNIVCSKEDWYYLIFYDIDRDITLQEIVDIGEMMFYNQCAYIIYKTKHGCHVVGLTPLNAMDWARLFTWFKKTFKSYYSGNVIRLSRKQDEKQELIKIVMNNREVIPNLYNLYCDRFNLTKKPWIKETSKYLLVFEKYRSVKE